MSETREQLARQSDTLKSIGSIVRTMKALSAINATPYEKAASDIKAYQDTLEKGFAAFAYCSQGSYALEKPAFASTSLTASQHTNKPSLHIIFGTDHGLCGSYNEQLATFFIENTLPIQVPHKNNQILCIGARMERALIDQDIKPYKNLMPPASVKGVNRLANLLVHEIQAFNQQQALQTSRVQLWFTQREEQGGHHPHQVQLLPVPKALFKPPQNWPSPALPIITMEEEALLTALIQQYLFVHLYRASAEAIATENAARLALMQQAEETVAERLAEVQLRASQVRQEEITTELMDIVMAHLA